ncbi:MAG: LSM domain-containing protein [bacterium]
MDHRIRITISDNRMIVGTFLAFDKHFNLVISETEEFRRIKPKKKGNNKIKVLIL